MKIISREQWGAAAPKSIPSQVFWPKGVTLWLHHTAGPPSQTVKQIQAFHQSKRADAPEGWNDIGYSYLIDEAGKVYEGRGKEVRGAHSPPVNHEPSVALIGTYSERRPTEAQRAAVWALRDYLGAGAIKGHRDSFATSCPGDAAYSAVITAGPPEPPKITLRERLMAAYFGGKSADAVIEKLRIGYEGDIPNPTDSVSYRKLRAAGFGHASAVRVIKVTRRKNQ